MKKLLLLSVAATLISSITLANVRRIGYWGNPVVGVDYATPALAVSNSAIGDTIYVYGSNGGNAWNIDVTKRLVIIGTGYFYAANQPDLASHAWVDVCLDQEAGRWVSIDVTHSCLIDERHVRLAMGTDYNACPPIKGIRQGGGLESMTVKITIRPV